MCGVNASPGDLEWGWVVVTGPPRVRRRGRWWPRICRRECAHAPAVLSYTTGVGDQVPGRLTVHPRVHRRHPELAEADVVAAWEGALVSGRTLEELGAPRRRP